MTLTKWSDIKAAMSPEQRARLDADVAKLNAEIEAARLVHYVVIRRDLTFGEYSAQLAHAGEAYAYRRDAEQLSRGLAAHDATKASMLLEPMRLNEVTAIVKGARNEGKLLKLEQKLLAASVPHIAVREEEGPRGRRLAGQLTCISLMPSNDPALRQLLNDFVEIKALDPIETPQTISPE